MPKKYRTFLNCGYVCWVCHPLPVPKVGSMANFCFTLFCVKLVRTVILIHLGVFSFKKKLKSREKSVLLHLHGTMVLRAAWCSGYEQESSSQMNRVSALGETLDKWLRISCLSFAASKTVVS